ncbi:MAG: tetratricopeptide repeat protein [Thermodesulfobacteriota bacterium]
MPSRIACLLLCLALALGLIGPSRAQQRPESPARAAAQPGGQELLWVELSVGGQPLRVRAGGVATLHPDAPFKVQEAKTSSWLDLGLSYRLKSLPQVNLDQYHTLTQLLGRHVYNTDQLELEVLKGGQVVGSIHLLVRLLPIDWLRLAREAQSLDDKITYTKKALELTPDDRLLMERLVDLLVEARRYDQAAALLEQQAANQTDPRWLSRLADLYERLGQNQKAAAALSQLAALHPRNAALLDRLAKMYEKDQRWEEAAAVLAKFSDLNSGLDRARALRRLAQAQQKAGQASAALQSLEQAVTLAPRDVELWRELAQARTQAGDRAGALQALTQAAQVAPGDLRLHLDLSRGFLAAGDKRRAAAELEKAAALQPKEPAHLLGLAKLYSDLGDRKALANTYRRLSALQPDDPDLNYNLGVLLFEEGQYADSLRHLQKVASVRPQDKEAQQMLFRTLVRLKRWPQAVAQAKKMLRSRPGDEKLVELIYGALAQERPQDAAALLDLVLAKKPQQVRPYQMRAALALQAEDRAAAIKALSGAAQAQPKNLQVLAQLAGLLEAEERPAEALKVYAKILDQDPNFPGVAERYLALRTQMMRQERKKGPPSAPPAPPAPPAKDKPRS